MRRTSFPLRISDCGFRIEEENGRIADIFLIRNPQSAIRN